MPTTAIVLGVTGAATQAYSAYEQSKSASNATKAETAAGQQALQIEQQQYQQGRTDLAPYRQAGSGALSKLGQIFGVPMGGDPTSIPTGPPSPTALTSSNGQPLSLQPGTLTTPGSAPKPSSSIGGVSGLTLGMIGMSGQSGATVPVQAPDGNIYRVPQAQLSAALQQGGKQVSQ